MKKALGYTAYFLAIIIFSVFFIRYIGQRTIVEGNSMLPALADADQLVSDKISYRFRDPERFDIIFFKVIKINYGSIRKGAFMSTGSSWRSITVWSPSNTRAWRKRGSPWKKTSILSWETTAISARTAATLTWAISGGRTS